MYFASPNIVNTFTKCADSPKHTTFGGTLLAAINNWITSAIPLEFKYGTLEKSSRILGRPRRQPVVLAQHRIFGRAGNVALKTQYSQIAALLDLGLGWCNHD